MSILVYVEIATAIVTTLLAVAAFYQIRKIHKEKIEEWRLSHLDSHYSKISKEIKKIEKQITDNDGNDNRGFEQLFTPRNHWIMTDKSLSVINNKELEIRSLIEKDSIAMQHIASAYQEIADDINKINSSEIEYGNEAKNIIQILVTKIKKEFMSELKGWELDHKAYDSMKELIDSNPFVVNDTNASSRMILLYSLSDVIINLMILDAYEIEAIKKPFVGNSHNYDLSLTFKAEGFCPFVDTRKVIAEVRNYYISDEEISEFSKICNGILSCQKEVIKKLFEKKKKITKSYSALVNKMNSEILNKYEAGLIIKGECEVCKLIHKAKDNEVRPYIVKS
ncbi:hypothetical protein [Caldiplasma sukawensis]